MRYEEHAATVENIIEELPGHDLYLIGDYNLPKAVWSCDNMGVTVPVDAEDCQRALCDSFAFLGLHQLNGIRNANGVLLDLLFSADSSAVVKVALDILLPCDAHH